MLEMDKMEWLTRPAPGPGQNVKIVKFTLSRVRETFPKTHQECPGGHGNAFPTTRGEF